MATNTPAVFYRGNPQYGTTNVSRNVTTAALTSNLVTLTFGSNHGLTQVGTLINVLGVGASYDGLFPVHSFPGLNTATYVVTTGNIASASVTPNGSAIFNSGVTSGQSISNTAIVNYTAIVTTSSPHGLAIGDIVRVNTGQTGIDGTWTVSSTPSTTLFTFSSTTQTLASGAITQGAFGAFPTLYTVPASTSAIVTDIEVTNPTATDAQFTFTLDNVPVTDQTTVLGNATTIISIKQFIATGKKINIGGSIPRMSVNLSGITIV
jgi:hypothetical protein